MEKINSLYIDMSCGVAGDMLLASLLHIGTKINNSSLENEKEGLLKELTKLKLEEKIELDASFTKVSGITAVKINFLTPEDDWSLNKARVSSDQQHHGKHHHGTHRHFSKIKEIISDSDFSDFIKEKSLLAFETIGLAEAKVHGQDLQKIHFHEVGSLDAILEIVGFYVLVEKYKIDKIYSSPIVIGSGYVNCQHGKMPVPVPAVVEMLNASSAPFKKIYEETGELTTPTGLGLVLSSTKKTPEEKYYGENNFFPHNFFFPKEHTTTSNGCGAGHKTIPHHTNILRLLLLREEKQVKILENGFEEDEVVEIISNIDDQSSEDMGLILEKLLDLGAKDASYHPISMKKGRTGFCLNIITDEQRRAEIEKYLLLETTTLGFRYRTWSRKKLTRQSKQIKIVLPKSSERENSSQAKNGKKNPEQEILTLSVKESYYQGKLIKYKIEYESLKEAQKKSSFSWQQIKERVNQYYQTEKA